MLIACALGLLCVAAPDAAAAAPVFQVNSTLDVAADSSDTDYTQCRTSADSTVCTLRAAIMKANRYPGGGVTIYIPDGTYNLTIRPTVTGGDDDSEGDLNITAPMSISGAGAATCIIDGQQRDRVFFVGRVAAAITGVTIRNGHLFGAGAGVFNQGNLTITDSVVSGNEPSVGEPGGGILTQATLTLIRVRVHDNRADGYGGGIYVIPGATATFTEVEITDNVGGSGGGVCSLGTLTLNRSIIAGNIASSGSGGGLYLAGTATITDCTVNANRVHDVLVNYANGGGIYVAPGVTVSVNDSTLSANGALASGGGMYAASNALVFLYHVTLAGNIADNSFMGTGTGGALFAEPSLNGEYELTNTLVAENYSANQLNDCTGFISSQGYNYLQAATVPGECQIFSTTAHNISGGDALLDALRDNGGGTLTRALFVGSPAIDRIPPTLCRDSFGAAPVADQRGVKRPVNDLCDIGAYEGAVPLLLYDRNLIRNNDAENGAGSPNGALVGVPNWMVTDGQFTAVPYGSPAGFPNVSTDMVPASHGYNFFAGGNVELSKAQQTIDVSALAMDIDAHTVTYAFAADLGGFGAYDDNAVVSMSFANASSTKIDDLVVLGTISAADRGNATGFRSRSTTGSVPPNTRFINVEITMTRNHSDTIYNHGYADNLSLVLTSTVPTATPLATTTPTDTLTSTPASTSTATATPTITATSMFTATLPPTLAATLTATVTSTVTPPPPTATQTATSTLTTTLSPSPAVTPSQTATSTATPTATLTQRPAATASHTPTLTPQATVQPSTMPTPTPQRCVGDCNEDGNVTVDELLTLVNIALGGIDISACTAGDADGNQQVTVDEILAAVTNALSGCGAFGGAR